MALVGGYLLGITSERKLVMELQCNMALRWFVGVNLDQDAWDASTFSQNRRRRFDHAGLLEQFFDDTITRAMAAGLVSRHVSADGTPVRANASYKSFLPIEVALDPEEYKRRLRAEAAESSEAGPPDPGNPTVNFRGEKRSNAMHRSATDPDCRFVSKGISGTGAPSAARAIHLCTVRSHTPTARATAAGVSPATTRWVIKARLWGVVRAFLCTSIRGTSLAWLVVWRQPPSQRRRLGWTFC